MFHQDTLDEILDERVVKSRGKRNKRGVKRKMSNYPIKKKEKTKKIWNNTDAHIFILSQQYWG